MFYLHITFVKQKLNEFHKFLHSPQINTTLSMNKWHFLESVKATIFPPHDPNVSKLDTRKNQPKNPTVHLLVEYMQTLYCTTLLRLTR